MAQIRSVGRRGDPRPSPVSDLLLLEHGVCQRSQGCSQNIREGARTTAIYQPAWKYFYYFNHQCSWVSVKCSKKQNWSFPLPWLKLLQDEIPCLPDTGDLTPAVFFASLPIIPSGTYSPGPWLTCGSRESPTDEPCTSHVVGASVEHW